MLNELPQQVKKGGPHSDGVRRVRKIPPCLLSMEKWNSKARGKPDTSSYKYATQS